MGFVQGFLELGSIYKMVIVGCVFGPGELCFMAEWQNEEELTLWRGSISLIWVGNWEGFLLINEKTGFDTLGA